MSLDITPDFVGLWFVPLTKTQDWLSGTTDLKDGRFRTEYRFRYYSPVGDGNPFNDEDVKSWYSFEISGKTREEVIALQRTMAETLSDKTGEKCYELLMVNGDEERFFREMRQLPFFHRVEVPQTSGVPDGSWRCRCGHINEVLYGCCDGCARPITESYSVTR